MRTNIRYAIRGILLSILLLLAIQMWCAWQVFVFSQPNTLPEHADVAVVLGAAAWGEKPSPVFRERINHALSLYQTGVVDKLIFTGGTPKSGFTTEAEVAKKFAIKQGIKEYDIFFENRSKDTFQNLVNTRFLMKKHQLNSAIIVTDPYHTARSIAIAHDLGINATASPTPTSRYNQASFSKRMKFFVQESYLLFAYRILHFGHKFLG
jgi:hypothetical protein